jgi:hypothetical protein
VTFARLARWIGVGVGVATSNPSFWPPATWRVATAEDWPPAELLGEDFDWARRTGTGLVADFKEKKWFLLHRDWFGWPDPPEWSLASFKADGEGWRFYDDFDVLPQNWVIPEVQNAPN